MLYKEYSPIEYLSHHVESFWEIINNIGPSESENFIIPPEMNFEIILVSQPIFLKFIKSYEWYKLNKGIYFIGLITQSLVYNIQFGNKIFGIRLKPFALSNIIKVPLCNLINRIINIQNIFDINKEDFSLIRKINRNTEDNKIDLTTKFISRMIEINHNIDQTLRAQLNYIKNHRGDIKVSRICDNFNVSKVTLRHNFLSNIGLTAKDVSKIWRFNHFLTLVKKNPLYNLTQLSLEAGYYDQSHFIKEFHFFVGISPKKFLKYNYHIDISQERIDRRFNSYYAPS